MKSYRTVHLGKDVGRRYDAMHADKVDSLIWDHFVKPMLREELQRAADAGARRYLDFACGTGRITKIGASVFSDATGIDISEDMLEVARSRAPTVALHCVDVTRQPDAMAGPFDCVTLFRFLLNAEPDLRREVLDWLSSVMPQGASLIGNTHQHTASFGGLATMIGRGLGQKQLNHLSRAAVERLLGDAGFRVERWEGFRVLPTVGGKGLAPEKTLLMLERGLRRMGVGLFGAEQVFVARRS